jgi:hypothetical protein
VVVVVVVHRSSILLLKMKDYRLQQQRQANDMLREMAATVT